MKYSETNPPLVCLQKNSTCYNGTNRMKPRGVLWHDTACGNPQISRYVQPHETDENYAEMIALLGKNRYGNDWNHKHRKAGMNCFIGKLADGTVATVQTMPWDYAPWGCGSGKNGSLNNTHMQFEICDDFYESREYFEAVYREACEITAYYCKMYGLDPLGSFPYNGVEVPVITSHAQSHDLGLGSDHSDTDKWMKKYGKTMDDARKDVARLMGILPEETPEPPAETPQKPEKSITVSLRTLKHGDSGEAVRALQILLLGRGESLPRYGLDGDFGQETENAVKKFQKKNGLTDDGVPGQLTWSELLGVRG